MIKFFPKLFLLLVFLQGQICLAQTVDVVTELGTFEVTLDSRKAPVTVKNFMRYVDLGYMKNTSFYRTVTLKPDNQPQNKVKIEVIQGGWKRFDDPRPFPDIRLETTRETGLIHEDGTISMARDKPHSASTEFFICVGAQPELDYGGKRNPDGQGFAAFGKVTRGMEVVRAIHRARSSEQTLKPRIQILDIRRHRDLWFTDSRP